ncbi:hypothetical protein SAMN02982996_00609 [Lonsdalea quercina]|uniref:Uncharacterized protein n=1 Tax=Lonsdalea quercina TaxID=71657 RepID=A0A1H3XF86_9GAMM|nr:hypothetical protein SAMN02982996_00609 [Lonsdalea quercina]
MVMSISVKGESMRISWKYTMRYSGVAEEGAAKVWFFHQNMTCV